MSLEQQLQESIKLHTEKAAIYEQQHILNEETRKKLQVEQSQKLQQLTEDVGALIQKLNEKTPETRHEQMIDLTTGDTNLLYPVWWTGLSDATGVGRISIVRHSAWNKETRPLNPESPHQAGLLLEMEINGYPWAGSQNFLEIKRFGERYAKTVSHVAFAMKGYMKKIRPEDSSSYGGTDTGLNDDGGLLRADWQASGCYLRGGLLYKVIKNWGGDDINFYNPQLLNGEPVEIFRYESGNARGEVRPIPLSMMEQPEYTLNAFVDK